MRLKLLMCRIRLNNKINDQYNAWQTFCNGPVRNGVGGGEGSEREEGTFRKGGMKGVSMTA